MNIFKNKASIFKNRVGNLKNKVSNFKDFKDYSFIDSNSKSYKRYFNIFILVIVISLLLVHTVSGVSPEPGSDEDPLVTKSYVDSELGKFTAQINSKINMLKSEFRKSKSDETTEMIKNKLLELEKTVNSLNKQIEEQSKYSKFSVVELEAGQSIIFGDSTEIILRSGKALAIAGEKGDGLADITTDSKRNNLVTDDIVPVNHLLLAARDDGRGIKAVTKIWVLVKGDYRIKGEDDTGTGNKECEEGNKDEEGLEKEDAEEDVKKDSEEEKEDVEEDAEEKTEEEDIGKDVEQNTKDKVNKAE